MHVGYMDESEIWEDTKVLTEDYVPGYPMMENIKPSHLILITME